MRTVETLRLAPIVNDAANPNTVISACGNVRDERVLIVGHDSLEPMCALIRRGARQVTTLRLTERPEPHCADLVLAPHIESETEAAGFLAVARRALAPFGRIVLLLPTETKDRMARRVARMLPTYALSLVKARRLGAWTLIAAERPFGPPATRA